jgi:chitinase
LTAAVAALGAGADNFNSTAINATDFINLMVYDENEGNHASYQYMLNSVSYWQGRGLAKSKMVVGVPYYARPSWSAFKNLVPSYGPCTDSGGGNWWNGIKTMRAKGDYVRSNGLAGLMNWEMSQDKVNQGDSLTLAISQVLKNQTRTYYCP